MNTVTELCSMKLFTKIHQGNQQTSKLRRYWKSDTSGQETIFYLFSKGYEKTFRVAIYLLFVLRQAFYLKLNLTATKPFWADVTHRYSFITKFSWSFINADITSPGVPVITRSELKFDWKLHVLFTAIFFLLARNKSLGNSTDVFKILKCYKVWRKDLS